MDDLIRSLEQQIERINKLIAVVTSLSDSVSGLVDMIGAEYEQDGPLTYLDGSPRG